MKYLWWISTVLLVLVLSPMSVAQDPCSTGAKKSSAWDVKTTGFHEVIPGIAGKRISVCGVVFSSSANPPLQITFDAGVAGTGCSEVTAGFGSLSYTTNTVVSAGGGSSTQFTVQTGGSLCIFFSGVAPLEFSGWVVYVPHL